GIVRRHTNHDGALALASNLIPDRQLVDRPRVHDAQAVIRMIDPVAKAVNAQGPGVLARRHAHPGRYGDWWNDRREPPVAAGIQQAADVREPLVVQQQFGCGAIEADDKNLQGHSGLHSRLGPGGTPKALSIVGARSSRFAPSARNALLRNKTPGTREGSIRW